MSGPKVVDVRESQRAEERRRNRRHCDAGLAEFSRLQQHHQELLAQLAAVKAAEAQPPLAGEPLQQRLQDLLGRDRDADAVRLCDQEIAQVKAALQRGRARLKERTEELQRRFRQLSENRQKLQNQQSRLTAYANSVVPAAWPDKDKERIKNSFQLCLAKVVPPAAVEPALNPSAIGQLEQAETLAVQAERTLDQVRQQLERDLNQTHAQLLTGKLAGHGPAPKRLEDVAMPVAAATSAAPPDPKLFAKLDDLLGELAGMRLSGDWSELARKGAAIRLEPDERRRQMLYDGLLIELSERMKRAQTLAAWQTEVDQLLDSVAHLEGTAVDPLVAELRALRGQNQVVKLDPLKTRLRQTASAEEKRLERERRRKAILDSLFELGYAPGEPLQTATVQGGRLVLQKPDEEEYAVEVALNEEHGLMQTRLLRFAASAESSSRQRQRDREREESWCEDHGRLLEKLARHGLETKYRVKIPPGQQAVAVVVDQARVEQARQRAAQAVGRRRQGQANYG